MPGDVRSLGQSGSYLKMLGLQLVIQTKHSADDSPATHSMADMLMSPPRLCNGAVHSNSLRENDDMH